MTPVTLETILERCENDVTLAFKVAKKLDLKFTSADFNHFLEIFDNYDKKYYPYAKVLLEVIYELAATFSQAKAVFKRAQQLKNMPIIESLALQKMLDFASDFLETKEVALESKLINSEIFKAAIEKMIKKADTFDHWKDIYDMSNNYSEYQINAFRKMHQIASSFSELKTLHSMASREVDLDEVDNILKRMSQALKKEIEIENDQEKK